jgi:hypothetical protein
MIAQVEYVGFRAQERSREYTLLVKRVGDDPRTFTLAIPTEAFLAHRLRYQDAPEICFIKLQRELAACPDGLPQAYLSVTDSDLLEYRQAHSPKAPQRRPRPKPQES